MQKPEGGAKGGRLMIETRIMNACHERTAQASEETSGADMTWRLRMRAKPEPPALSAPSPSHLESIVLIFNGLQTVPLPFLGPSWLAET